MVLPLSFSYAGEEHLGCTEQGPVLNVGWDDPYVWQLPLSVDRPKTLTEARFSVQLQEPLGPGRPWTAILRSYFPDPKPFGIPYTFEKMTLSWANAAQGAPSETLLDWTAECTSAGRSLFPGKQWTQELELPGTESLSTLDRVQLRVWGSRN